MKMFRMTDETRALVTYDYDTNEYVACINPFAVVTYEDFRLLQELLKDQCPELNRHVRHGDTIAV